jgi:hypothetical protein
VSSWERLGDWIATATIASFAWVSALVAPGMAAEAPAATVEAPGENELSWVVRWAQAEDEPPIEQVGEETDGDVETLDDEAAPPDEVDTTEDVELLDQGPPADEQDVELLDQGPQAITTTESPAVDAVSTDPVTTYVAPVDASVPVVPAEFGTGDVHVATGGAGFPVGLEDCHVGAVTGRAYVGVDCGDGTGDLVVGHAPSFEEFPFVLEENFPFDRESVFADGGETTSEDRVVTLVSAAGGTTRDDNSATPEIRTGGPSSVAFEQRARDRKPRVETDNGAPKRRNDKRGNGNAGIAASESQDAAGITSAESKQQKKNKGKDRVRRGSRADDEKKATNSRGTKKNGEKKSKKQRATN